MKPCFRACTNACLLLILLGFLQLLGCSEDLTTAPPVEVPFTLFGVVNPTADTQAVIVYPVQSGTLVPIGPEPLDAAVRSTDLETGEVRAWRDSVVWDGDRGYSHIFWSDFRAEFGHRYDVVVRRADGAEAAVALHVPPMITIEGMDDGTRRMQVAFRGVPFRLVQLRLTYGVRGIPAVGGTSCAGSGTTFHYTFPYAGEENRQEYGWELGIDLARYVPLMEQFVRLDTGCDYLFEDPDSRLALMDLTLHVTVGNEAWEVPHGFLDRRILSHPGTLTNVENGLGFVGAGYRDQARLLPSRAAIEDAGFYNGLDRRPVLGESREP